MRPRVGLGVRGGDAPVFSAHLTRPRAARSLTDPPGFMNSAFPRISHPVSSESELMRICGGGVQWG